MNKFPTFFIDNSFSDKTLCEKILNRMKFTVSTSFDNSDIIISSKRSYDDKICIFFEKQNRVVISNSSDFTAIEDSKIFNLIELSILKSTFLFYDNNVYNLYDLKDRYRNKISKFLQALVVTMEVEDKDTNMSHSQRVAFYSEEFSKFLGKDDDEIKKIKELAMLHDIGRIGIEQLMLFTPTRINDFETWDLEHTVTGSIFLSSIDELWFSVPVVRSHHEFWNGTGYPDGLSGEEIPYYARYIGLIDWFDIATHTATSEYEGILSPQQAIDFISNNSGILFDPILANKFVEFINNFLEKNKFV
ncbi:HD domain-containing protein [Oceanotoga teriensis]|uniref:HD domain-containing protein n=1 Tax=Oceanotoga teriensis TaxID=515440 RepID=A0AA45C8W7_9BACT|nr:HD domain-containing phosphohydrolase [Oceanotoga teriensis]PWJ96322.1 HD domain-containing protein [Oceanotoga teriensis]